MPELPEVEVTRRQLEPLLVGRTLRQVGTAAASLFFLTAPAVLRRRLPGRRIVSLVRRGKYLLARLDDDASLLLHLGMTGQLFAGEAGARVGAPAPAAACATRPSPFRPDRHTHLRLRFADGGPDVFFRDARRFGRVQLLRGGEPSPRLARLGVDALRARSDAFFAAARKRRTIVKTLLLDQSVLAGVGNIYADEALFLARVRPTRRSDRLSRQDCRRLLAALRQVLRRSIAKGGSSISDYVRPDGTAGAYQDERRVYGRTGEPCPRCRTSILRRVLASRSAHFCPRCQR